MPIAVACPSCKAKMRAPDKLAGKKAKCPKCGKRLAIPASKSLGQSTPSPEIDLELVAETEGTDTGDPYGLDDDAKDEVIDDKAEDELIDESSPFADLANETAQSRLTSLKWRSRLAPWLLQWVRIRQTARKAFDITRLGTGPAERLCSAFIFGAVFFFVVFLLAHLAEFQANRMVGLAISAFVSVMATSSLLVVLKTDAQLRRERRRLEWELTELPLALLEARAERDTEEAQLEAEMNAARKQHDATVEAAKRGVTVPEESVKIDEPTTKCCPYCREVILISAVKCKHCGEFLDEALRRERRPRQKQSWSPGVAAVLSFLWPGLGQMYKGEVLAGIAWMFFVVLGYCLFLVPGFVLHIICIFAAASGSEE